ncbi:MAG: rod shape-determining protein MreC [Oscillospiraceae bacterium]|nr:rod shape-determining protein MreC [Oscillospiraceae bacterium]
MKKYLKTKGVVIGGITFLLVLIALLSLLGVGRTSFVQNTVAAITRPVETGIRNFVGTLEQMYNHMHNYDTLEAEHRELLARVAAYERRAREAEEIREENERLRTLLGLSQGIYNERLVDAAVLSWDASNWTSAFTIDRGEDYGIAVGDAVMTERRELVGVVRQVGRNWARVETIIDPSVRVGGQMGTGVSGIAEGNFALMGDWTLRLSLLPTGEVPLLNDVITTSGYGGVIPKGLVIGRVERVGMEGTGVSYYAIIQPAAELNRLVQVFVVQNVEIDS